MTTKNEHTGDALTTRASSEAYRSNWDKIFGTKEEEPVVEGTPPVTDEIKTALQLIIDNVESIPDDLLDKIHFAVWSESQDRKYDELFGEEEGEQ